MPQGFRDALFNSGDVPPIILAGGGVDSSVDTSLEEELPVPVLWPEDEEGFDEPLEETLTSLPQEENESSLMLFPIEEELCHPRSASQRVVDALKRSSLLPTVVSQSQGSWSYGEIFREASRLADDLEKSLHDGKSEECGTLAGESCWDFYIVLSNFVYLF